MIDRISVEAKVNIGIDKAMALAGKHGMSTYEYTWPELIGKGFTDPRGSKTTVTSSDQATMLIAPSGFPVVISEHFK